MIMIQPNYYYFAGGNGFAGISLIWHILRRLKCVIVLFQVLVSVSQVSELKVRRGPECALVYMPILHTYTYGRAIMCPAPMKNNII